MGGGGGRGGPKYFMHVCQVKVSYSIVLAIVREKSRPKL